MTTDLISNVSADTFYRSYIHNKSSRLPKKVKHKSYVHIKIKQLSTKIVKISI